MLVGTRLTLIISTVLAIGSLSAPGNSSLTILTECLPRMGVVFGQMLFSAIDMIMGFF